MSKPTVAVDIKSRLKLNDGHEIPWYGLGTYKSAHGPDGPAEKSVVVALQNNHRLIDTAQFYENEEDVGNAIIKSGIPREDVYIVTKLLKHGYNECKESFKESLQKLKTNYVDLFLIHSPRGGKNIESYDAMIELQNQGLIRSIGVSNFGVHHLEALKAAGKPMPAVNQIELHPFCRYESVVEYCRQNGIAVMGYSPLTRGKYLTHPTIIDIAERCNKSPAQVLLRWSIQSGYITIPKSEKADRILTNADIFNFTISFEDMALMNNFPTDIISASNRLDIPWEG